MSVPEAYVHALSTERDAVLDFVEAGESSFLEFGVAPDVGRPREIPLASVREWAETPPTATDGGGWLAYLTPELLNVVGADEGEGSPATLWYAGVAGMAVVDRVLRETTGYHPDVALQSHTYASTPTEYAVYRPDPETEEFVAVASGIYE